MCLINFQFGDHPEYKLIVAANRDESYDRPTKEVHYWDDEPYILAGRDLRGMGTWLGITKTGRIAMLTNIRTDKEMLESYRKTRGELVSGFLSSSAAPEEYLSQLIPDSVEYAGFNLLVGDADHLYYMNNYENQIVQVTDGVHGLSNHYLDTEWPKVIRGMNLLESLAAEAFDTEAVFDLLRDKEKATDSELPETGLSRELEYALSSMFIDTPYYGTRCSTVLTVSHDNEVRLSERTYLHDDSTGQVDYDFKIDSGAAG